MSTSTKVGPFRVRPQLKHGNPTGKWFLDIPARLTGNRRRMRKLYPTRSAATTVARELKRRIDPVMRSSYDGNPAKRSCLRRSG